jgi:hypothetical protein
MERFPTSALPALPILLLSAACSSVDPATKIAEWKDHQLKDFDVEVLSTRDRIEGIGYDVLELATGSTIDEGDTDGHKNFTLPIHTSSSVDDWDFDRDDKALYVTKKWWCETALPWMNVYTHILTAQHLCVEDTGTCSQEARTLACDIEHLWELYDEALDPEEEEDTAVEE